MGRLQFEVVASRLRTEYKAEALYSPSDIYTTRRLALPDEATRHQFKREQVSRLALGVDGNPVYLASNRYNLELTMEQWPRSAPSPRGSTGKGWPSVIGGLEAERPTGCRLTTARGIAGTNAPEWHHRKRSAGAGRQGSETEQMV